MSEQIKLLQDRCNTDSTFKTYKHGIAKFAELCPDVELNQQGIEEFVDRLKEAGYSAQTINSYVYGLKKVAKISGIGDVLVTNLPKIETKPPETISKDEVRKLIENISDTRDKAIIALMYDCALRLEELRMLDLEDLDFQERSIFVSRKGGLPQKLYFGQKTHDILMDYLNERKRRGVYDTIPALFVSRTRISRWEVGKVVRFWSKTILDKKIHPHILRHSRALHLRDHGVNLEDLKDFLGHSNINTTFIYARMSSKQLKEISNISF